MRWPTDVSAADTISPLPPTSQSGSEAVIAALCEGFKMAAKLGQPSILEGAEVYGRARLYLASSCIPGPCRRSGHGKHIKGLHKEAEACRRRANSFIRSGMGNKLDVARQNDGAGLKGWTSPKGVLWPLSKHPWDR